MVEEENGKSSGWDVPDFKEGMSFKEKVNKNTVSESDLKCQEMTSGP